MLRKSIAILLLILFAYNIFGFYYCFIYKQNKIRSEIKTQIKNNVPQEQLIILTFTKKQVKKLAFQDENEFRLNGKMYDIVKTTIKNNIITYFCINDVQEEELFESLNEQVSNNLDNILHKNNFKKNYIKTINDFFIEEYNYKYNNELILLKINYLISESINCRLIPPFVPPPKI